MPSENKHKNDHIDHKTAFDYTEAFSGYTFEATGNGQEYKGRPIIGRDSRISGGVYYGTYQGEAIVIDPEKYPDIYDKWYKEAKQLATDKGSIDRNYILYSVFRTVKMEMPYSMNGVDDVLSSIAKDKGDSKFQDGTKVELSIFMNGHVGVCRHQALAAGVLLERFVDEGYLKGKVSVDRNESWDANGEPEGGHAWVRYTTSADEVYILDVAQDYAGTLEDSKDNAHWNYLRPEEKQQIVAPKMGKTAMAWDFLKRKAGLSVGMA